MQEEIFGAPGGLEGGLGGRAAERVRPQGRWRLGAQRQGRHCSGIPYSNHYMGQAPPSRWSLAVLLAPRSSSSRPAARSRSSTTGGISRGWWAAARTRSSSTARLCRTTTSSVEPTWATLDLHEGTIGYRMPGNPMYNSRGLRLLHDVRWCVSWPGVLSAGRPGAHPRRATCRAPPFGPRAADPTTSAGTGCTDVRSAGAGACGMHEPLERYRCQLGSTTGPTPGGMTCWWATSPATRTRSRAGDAGVDLPLPASIAATTGAGQIERRCATWRPAGAISNTAQTDWFYGEPGRWHPPAAHVPVLAQRLYQRGPGGEALSQRRRRLSARQRLAGHAT